MEVFVPIFVVGIFWFTILAIVRASLNHGIRKKMVDKGMSGDEIAKVLKQPNSVDPYPNLKWGMILIGIGTAVMVGTQLDNEQLTAGLVLLMGGVGFLAYFLVTKKFHDNNYNK